MKLHLFGSPGACSGVTMTALEETGALFTTEVIRLMKQQHMTADYLANNPLGKVPCLIVDGKPMRENVAILLWLNEVFPKAKLLPPATDTFQKVGQTADLCFCSSTLHPIVTRIALPMMFGSPEAIPSIRASAETMMRRFFAVVEERLTGQRYWYGKDWSVMDAYLGWIYRRITCLGFDAREFSHFAAMIDRQASRPSAMRAAAREAIQQAQLVN